MSTYNPLIMRIAGEHKSLHEWPGAQHNPEVIALYAAVGHEWVQDDETPWCAAFVGAVLAEAGLPHTGKLNARSYLGYGVEVGMRDAKPGDIVVFWRGSRNGWQGHVAFLVRFEGDQVIVRGGNQGNRVSDKHYPLERVLGYRRAVPSDAVGNRPNLKDGSTGAFVRALQERLKGLRYFPGNIDGNYGPRTEASVREFQSAYHLTVDGVVGRNTWSALDAAVARPDRPVTKEKLREDGSRTMGIADFLKKLAGGGAGITIGGASVADVLGTDPAQVDQVSDLLDTAKTLALNHWWVALVLIGAGALWYAATRLENIRLDDARTGANLK